MKKFDFVIQNPPYDKNLHLKFLSKLLDVSNVVVSIQPIDNFILQAKVNSYSRDLIDRITTIDEISNFEANDIFKIYSSSNLGIIVKDDNIEKTYNGPKFNEYSDIYKKLRKFKSVRSSINCYDDEPIKPFVPLQGDYGYAMSWHYKLNEIIIGSPHAKMVFETEDECENFKDYIVNSNITKFIYIIDDNAGVIAHIPMLKDYTHKWTNEELYKYFDLSIEEQKRIENLIDNNYGR